MSEVHTAPPAPEAVAIQAMALHLVLATHPKYRRNLRTAKERLSRVLANVEGPKDAGGNVVPIRAPSPDRVAQVASYRLALAAVDRLLSVAGMER